METNAAAVTVAGGAITLGVLTVTTARGARLSIVTWKQ